MLGWHISVYTKQDDKMNPAILNSPKGACIAVWQAGMSGLKWIWNLEKDGKAVLLGGNGYPAWYTAEAQHLIPPIVAGPPQAENPWRSEKSDILLAGWKGKTEIYYAEIADCLPNEWLIVEAWDKS